MFNRVRRSSIVRSSVAALRGFRGRIHSANEVRVYSKRLLAGSKEPPRDLRIGKDEWADLEAYDAAAGWVSLRSFLAEARSRLNAGEHVYTVTENGRLIHYGWSAAPVERRMVAEVGHTAELSPRSAYLYDFFTHPACRNRGLYQSNLTWILRDLGSDPQLQSAYIVALAENAASRRAIENLAFQYEYSLFQEWRWNRVRRWSTK